MSRKKHTFPFNQHHLLKIMLDAYEFAYEKRPLTTEDFIQYLILRLEKEKYKRQKGKPKSF
ncbi:hypothetical protein ACFOU2_08495 [Bacillus songklensis]|uniref:Fur-regulated basic protein A n=1 Tax=Bacillus songklensis TaxID=1069116 RepID=A0ABV8B2Y1_9BACI